MKYLLITGMFLSFALFTSAQKKPAEKAPTQKEMQDMLKQAQQLLNATMKELTPEQQRIIDSLGIPIPDMNKAAKKVATVTDKQLKNAAEEDGRIVPKKNTAKIAGIPAPVSTANMSSYLSMVQSKTASLLPAAVKTVGAQIYAAVSTRSVYDQGTTAAALWMMGKPETAFYVMGKACAADPLQTDNLSNYAAMLSMLGAQDLALPILQNLNTRFPVNSTILNNIGQAWFGLGDMAKSEKYIDSAIRIYAYHTQANFTKCLIEESKGNKPEAIKAMKRSMKKAYTQEKEAKLKSLGYTPNENDFTIPGVKPADPLNLGGFTPPAFPKSVIECITLGQQWKGYREGIDEEGARLVSKLLIADKNARVQAKQRINTDMAAVKAKIANPDASDATTATPLYASRAAIIMRRIKENFDRESAEFGKKFADYLTGMDQMYKTKYENIMDDLREKDLEQTGEGKPNIDFCPKYQAASDDYLVEVNGHREALYKEFLRLESDYINDAAYWGMYIEYPEDYESYKLGLMAQWLKDLKNVQSGMDFISITKYVCKPPEKKGKGGVLQKFDDVNCKNKSSFWTPVGTMEMNCSQWTTTLELGIVSVTLKQDMDRAEGDQLENCTVTLGPKIGKEVKLGPVTVGATVGVGVGVEISRNGRPDVFLIGTVEGSAEIGGPVNVTAGVEGRISVISGTGSISGTGILNNSK